MSEVVSDAMIGEVHLQRSKTGLLCVDLQKCYYTHPITQHFPHLEKVVLSSLIRNQCTVNIKKIKILNLKLNQTFKGGERLARPLQSGQGSGFACYAGGLAPCELFGFQTIQEKVNG